MLGDYLITCYEEKSMFRTHGDDKKTQKDVRWYTCNLLWREIKVLNTETKRKDNVGKKKKKKKMKMKKKKKKMLNLDILTVAYA